MAANGSELFLDRHTRVRKIQQIAAFLALIEEKDPQDRSLHELAQKFENQMFTAAMNVEDYNNRISKKLSKVQKVRQQQALALQQQQQQAVQQDPFQQQFDPLDQQRQLQQQRQQQQQQQQQHFCPSTERHFCEHPANLRKHTHVCTPLQSPSALVSDRDALLALYHATGGAKWTRNANWNTDATLSQWHGVRVNAQECVVELALNFNNLKGEIPASLGQLSKLEGLYLSENKLSGPIPPELGNLSNLQKLILGGFDMDDGQLNGHTPARTEDLGKHWQLDLSYNQLSGRIPSQLGKLSALEKFDLSFNKLDGPIPPELGKLAALKELQLQDNQLTGPIPAELGNLAALEKLILWGNQLSGPILEELGALRKLETLCLHENELIGPIPPELGNLSNLQKLDLGGFQMHDGQLTGPIPKELGELGKLEVLRLQNNRLAGPIPKELGALSFLRELLLHSNELSGPIPPELGNLAALQHLDLSYDRLRGPIPEELGNLTALEKLCLAGNHLSGKIPASLGQLSELRKLDLGEIDLGKIDDLSGKYGLSGPIPKELGELGKLEVLWLQNNRLSGPIPSELGNLSALKKLHLWQNQLSGPIPSDLGNLSALKSLELFGNQLSGPIPEALGALSKLEGLDLSYNQLTAFWDHTQDIDGVGHEEGTNSESGGPVPSQLRRLLDVLDGAGSLQLGNNPWAEPPESIVAKGAKGIREYFEDLFSEPCRIQRNSVKVVLVGQEGAGKTSLCRSMKANKAAPTGEWKENSTVFVDVEPMVLEGASVRVYDCAGQVAYTGLLQMFLTPRSVCVLVCDAAAFENSGNATDGQVERDCRKLEELRVCDWLRSISRRVPGSDVILVATKCDLVGGSPMEVGGRIEEACRRWVASWVCAGMQPVTVEEGACRTSCCASKMDGQGEGSNGGCALEGRWACDWRDTADENDSSSLIHRLVNKRDGLGLRGAHMVLPRSWDIALTVLEALEHGRDPVQMTLRKLANPDGGEAAGMAKRKRGVYQGITLQELSAKWLETVHELANEEVTVTNPEHALEGALSIREFDGSLVRHETYVFLDVVWLARILKPLLNHKGQETFNGLVKLGDTGDTCVTLHDDLDIKSWGRLENEGVLEPRLARAIWPVGLSEYVLPTLLSLGLAFPLEGDAADELVVLLRLGEERPNDIGKELDDFRRDRTAVLSVTWKVFMGVPHGAIEKVLIRCCSIGALRTFWRFGVLVQGDFGAIGAGKTFALLIEYSHEKNEIEMQVYGNIGTAAPWAALSVGVSAVRTMCSEFPGLRWRASLRCPQHEQDMQISTTATRPGDKLLHGKTCSLCSPETGGLGEAATNLVEMVDVLQSRGEIFRQVNGRFVTLQDRFPVLRPEASRGLHPEQAQRRCNDWWKGMNELQGLLHSANESAQEEGVGGNAKAGEPQDASGVLKEVAQLRQLVEDVQSQLGQQHQDMRGWLSTKDQLFAHGIDADNGVIGKLDFIVAMLMAVRGEGFDTPRQACVLPPWKFAQAHGLSEGEQSPEVWVKRLQEWLEDDCKEGKGFFKKKKRLFLVCAHTRRLVPCGPNGQGYDIQQPRTWLRTSFSVATFALQVVCSTLAGMAVAPVAGAGAAVEAAVSTAMESYESKLEAQLAGLSLKDDGGADLDVGSQAAQLERGAYAYLREFIHGVEDAARMDIAKAGRGRRANPSSSFVFFAQEMVQVQRHAGDAAVQWVLKGQERAWLDAMGSAPIA